MLPTIPHLPKTIQRPLSSVPVRSFTLSLFRSFTHSLIHSLIFCLLSIPAVLAQQSTTVSAQSEWVGLKKTVPAAPVIVWQNPQLKQVTAPIGVYRVTVCLQSADPITRVQFVLNGTEIGGQQRGFKRVACGQSVTEDITLVPGPNELLVRATNAIGTTVSELRTITGQAEPLTKTTPVLEGQRRLALVMANGSYTRSPLKNPINDGRAVKNQLEALGFSVTYGENLSLKSLNSTLDKFLNILSDNTVGLVYYAGHGMMVSGENYVQPVDADPTDEPEVQYECYSMRKLIDRMEHRNPKGANLIFWDACRNNPYRSWYRSAGSKVFEPMGPAYGTLIIYATYPGKPAHDGFDGKHSLFTGELIRHINQPGVEIRDLPDLIEQGLAERNINQPPYLEGRLRGKFFFKPAQ